MNEKHRVLNAVRTALNEVAAAARSALDEGDFSKAAWCSRWAAALSKLVAEGPSAVSSAKRFVKTDSSLTSAAGVEADTAEGSRNRHATSPAGTAQAVKTSKNSRVGVKAVYPMFYRDNGSLVKIGWSKSQRNEYEHRAPKVAAVTLVDALSQGKAGAPLTMESLLPLKDEHGNDLPSYQAYLALAWLREADAVRRHGQEGYSLEPAYSDTSKLDELWGKLATSRPHRRV